MSPNELKLSQNLTAINQLDRASLAIYGPWIGLKQIRESAEAAAVASLVHQSNHMIALDPNNSAAVLFNYFRDGGKELATLTRIDAGIAALERSPGFADAVATCKPLHEERDAILADIEAERKARMACEQAAAEAHQAAVAAAIAKAESDPAVVKTRLALEKLNAPADMPTRGKIAIRAHHEADLPAEV